jgi:hypothetical protein
MIIPALALLGFGGAQAATPNVVNVCYGSSGYQGSAWTFSGAATEGPGAPCLSAGAAAAVADLKNGAFGALSLADGTAYSGVTLTGTGSFACGNGALTGTGSMKTVAGSWSLTWSATFANSIGTLKGKATSNTVTETVGGKLVVGDRAVGAGTIDCDDAYHPMSPMPTIDDVWTPPGSIPTSIPVGMTIAIVTLSK